MSAIENLKESIFTFHQQAAEQAFANLFDFELFRDAPDVMSAEDVSALLPKTSVQTVYRWADKGEIPARRVGNHVYFLKPVIILWLMLGGFEELTEKLSQQVPITKATETDTQASKIAAFVKT